VATRANLADLIDRQPLSFIDFSMPVSVSRAINPPTASKTGATGAKNAIKKAEAVAIVFMFTKLINNLSFFNLEVKDLEGFVGVYLNYCRAMLP
jgi:hypothetical protein